MNTRCIPFFLESDKSISEHGEKLVKSDVDLCKEFVSNDRPLDRIPRPLKNIQPAMVVQTPKMS